MPSKYVTQHLEKILGPKIWVQQINNLKTNTIKIGYREPMLKIIRIERGYKLT